MLPLRAPAYALNTLLSPFNSIYRAQVTEADGTRGVRAIKRLDKCLIAAGRTEAGLRARENVAMEVELLAMLRRRPHRHLLALGPLREQGHDHAHLSISVPFMEGGDLCSHGARQQLDHARSGAA